MAASEPNADVPRNESKQSIQTTLGSLAAKYRNIADLMVAVACEFDQLQDSFALLVPTVMNIATAQRTMAVTQNQIVSHIQKMQAEETANPHLPPLPEAAEDSSSTTPFSAEAN